MTVKIEDMLERIANGQREYVDAQKRQSEILNTDLAEIKESVRRIHSRLDSTAKETTVNTEALKYLKEDIVKSEARCESENKLIWEKMHDYKRDAIKTAQKNVMLKIYTSIVVSVGSLITAIIVAFTTVKLK